MLANQKCFVLQNNFTPKEAIDIIKKSNGLSFLAHPGFNILRGENLDLIFDKFSSYGVCGFAAFNIQFDKKNNNNQLNFSSEIEKKCLENNFLISGGSDFHTNIFSKRPHVKIGDDKICVPEKYFSEIEKKSQKK
jgi:predicted metal-dependent phosphoesterase TrpH